MHVLTDSANSGTGSGYTYFWVGECVREEVKEFVNLCLALRHEEEEVDSGGGKEWCKIRAFEANGFVGEKVMVKGEEVKSNIAILF